MCVQRNELNNDLYAILDIAHFLSLPLVKFGFAVLFFSVTTSKSSSKSDLADGLL
jgi:hypothetical protein